MIVKGSVCIRVLKEDLGKEPVNAKVCYDGDYVGELAHFTESESLTQEVVDRMNRQRSTAIAMEPTYALRINKLKA